MRWMILALVLPLSAAAQQKQECEGAPKPGTDDAGNFRFLRAIVERSPSFEVLKKEGKPISCDYKFGSSTLGESMGVIKFESGAVRLTVERHFGGCVEIRGAELTVLPRSEKELLSLLRKDMQYYAPGSEKKIAEESLSRKQFGSETFLQFGEDKLPVTAQAHGKNGAFDQFAYVASIGCVKEEANAKN